MVAVVSQGGFMVGVTGSGDKKGMAAAVGGAVGAESVGAGNSVGGVVVDLGVEAVVVVVVL